jgi:hypothetical protein
MIINVINANEPKRSPAIFDPQQNECELSDVPAASYYDVKE